MNLSRGTLCYVRTCVNRREMGGRICEVVSGPFLGLARSKPTIGLMCQFTSGRTLSVEADCLIPITPPTGASRRDEEISA